MKNSLFIPYDLALIAIEKGYNFDYYGIGWYYKRRSNNEIHGLDTFYIDTNQNIQQWEALDNPIEAILYQQILDWFRDKHKIHFEISFERGLKTYYGNIFKESNHNRVDFVGKDYYDTLNNGIKEAFKLI